MLFTNILACAHIRTEKENMITGKSIKVHIRLWKGEKIKWVFRFWLIYRRYASVWGWESILVWKLHRVDNWDARWSKNNLKIASVISQSRKCHKGLNTRMRILSNIPVLRFFTRLVNEPCIYYSLFPSNVKLIFYSCNVFRFLPRNTYRSCRRKKN